MEIGTPQAQAVVQLAFAGLKQQRDVSAIHSIDVVVGGQYGSEAKGHVTQQVIRRRVEEGQPSLPVLNIRVAGPNAGHTVYAPVEVPHHTDPALRETELRSFAFRQLPVGIVEDADRVFCAIAPGSEIDLEVLLSEIATVQAAGLWPKQRFLLIDPEATLMNHEDTLMEQASALRETGTTNKGIGSARSRRIWRRARRLGDDPAAMGMLQGAGALVRPVALLYAIPASQSGYDVNYQVVIEGTQGFGLGLHAGAYPNCTSSDCRAVDFLAMSGISPWELDMDDTNNYRTNGQSRFKVWVVVRPYPIRVAGPSGPLRGETTWEALGLRPERTTVTQKIRRVGAWDPELAAAAVRANGGGFLHTRSTVVLALTMADQISAQITDSKQPESVYANGAVSAFIEQIQTETGAVVDLVTTSPSTAVWLS